MYNYSGEREVGRVRLATVQVSFTTPSAREQHHSSTTQFAPNIVWTGRGVLFTRVMHVGRQATDITPESK